MKVFKLYRSWLFIIVSLLLRYDLPAQTTVVLETYYYAGKEVSAVVPMLHIETKNNWYAELRYNYEDVKTLSLFAGKTFHGGSGFEYSITPLVGYSVGRFKGGSFAVNAEAEWKDFFLSSQSQYSQAIKSVKEGSESFFFTWSEVGYNVTPHFYTGVAIQYTRLTDVLDFEPGFLAGLNFKNISFPCYVFSPFDRDRYFVLGLNYEFSLKKKKQNIL